MLTDDQLRTLARASKMYAWFAGEQSTVPYNTEMRDRALDALGRPDDDTVVTSAIGALASDDRNLRVAALRVLWWYGGDARVADAVLGASHDPARRVRRIAVGMLGMFLDRPGVAERLREVIEDPREKPKIGGQALSSLVYSGARPLPESVQRSVADLLDGSAYRGRILLFLLQQPQDDASRALLREIVRSGSKGEAVAATHALCGLRMTNLAHVRESERKHVVATCEPVDLTWVSGTTVHKPATHYWIPVDGMKVRGDGLSVRPDLEVDR